MNTAAIKDRLHEYIEQADAKRLKAIYTLLERELEPQYEYDAATLKMLYQRREDHVQGKSKSYSVKEAFDSIRKSKR